jgi:hypothetical protein
MKHIVESQLAPLPGWETAHMMVKEAPQSVDGGVGTLWKDHPDILK